MAAALEARAVILGEDRTGPAFDSVKARIAGLAKQIAVMDRATGSVGAIAKSVDAIGTASTRATADLGKFTDAARNISTVSSAISNVDRASAAMSASMARSSSSVAKLSAELSTAEGKLRAIENFKGSSRALDQAGLAFKKSQQDVRLLAAEMARTADPSKQMHANFGAAQASVARLSEEFRVEGAAAREARAALSELGVPLNRLRTEEERLQATIEGTTRALHEQAAAEHLTAAATQEAARAAERAARDQQRLEQRQAREAHQMAERRAEGMGHHGFGNFVLQSAAMAVGAGEIVHLGAEAVDRGAELQHERIGMQNAGRTPAEMAMIEAAARKVVGTQPTASMLDAMKVVSETTTAFGSVEHAVSNLPFMMQAMSVLKAAGGEHIHGGAGDVGRALAKTFEERQTRPEDFEAEAKAMIPAMVVSGGTFNPEQLYSFAQQAKSALPSLSMRFLSRIAPSLIGAQGGDRAGTALNAFESVISGKANDKKQAQEWLGLGLLDPSKVIMKGGQATSWKSGAVKDTFLAMTDPLAWSEKYLIPALQKQGVDTGNREAVKQVLDTMFRNQNANVFASEITQAASRARLHKDEGLINEAGNFDDIYARNMEDFGVAAGAFKSAIGNLAASATAPLMRTASISITRLAGALNEMAKYGLEHPGIAAGAGVAVGGGALAIAGRLAWRLQNGFGLGASATALDAAAAHLMSVGVGGLPGGKLGAAAREGEHLAGGALAAEAIEIAATGAVTLTAGTVGLIGLTAGGILAALRMSMDPKHHASDDPDFAAHERDPNWSPHAMPAHPNSAIPPRLDRGRVEARSQVDTDATSHIVIGRGGVRQRVSGAALSARGYLADRYGGEQADTPLPFSVPNRNLSDGRTKDDVIRVAIVNGPTAGDFHDHWLDGGRQGIERRSELAADHFRRDPEAARGEAMVHLETGPLDTAAEKATLIAHLMGNLDGLNSRLNVDTAAVDAAIAKLERLKGAMASVGTTGSTGPSRVVADPGVGRSR